MPIILTELLDTEALLALTKAKTPWDAFEALYQHGLDGQRDADDPNSQEVRDWAKIARWARKMQEQCR